MKSKTFKSILLATFFLLGFGIISGFAQTPDAVVKELYKIHDQDLKSGGDQILNRENRKYIDKFFDKTMADFIWKDLTTNVDEVGVLDFDPFYNAQDFEIKNFSVGAAKIIGQKASVTVKFTNAGRRETLVYQLVRQNSIWKVADIKYSDGSSLLGYFKQDAKQNN
jgi:Protein of unknown function (DUF3828)